ncbi:MAG: flagellar basal body P-ring formation chaperone FlgA [Pikeienuella sp.]
MTRALAVLVLLVAMCPAVAQDAVTAARTLRPGTVLQPGDLRGPAEAQTPLLGLEVRRAIYVDRPVRSADLGPETLVRRNQIVAMLYRKAGLEIRAEGRALDPGGAGERIRVMNLGSRHWVAATVLDRGAVEVRQ